MAQDQKKSADESFSDYAFHYLHNYRTRNGYGPKVAPSTMRKKKTSVLQLVSYFGSTPLSSITPDDIVKCLSALEKHGKSIARTDMAELKTLFHRASMENGQGIALLSSNPAADIPTPPDPPSLQARKKPITPEQEDKLYQWFLARRPEWAILIPLACNVDLRPEDYLALKVGDIDPQEQTIDIVRSQSFITGHGLITKDPKTWASGQKRYIPAALMHLIVKHIQAHTNGQPSSWLVEGPHGGMLSEWLFYKWFKQAAAGIGRPELSPYVMRATADDRISRCRFGNMKEMLAMQGRSDAATSVRHYQKLDPFSMRLHAEEVWAMSHPNNDHSNAQTSFKASSKSTPSAGKLLTQMRNLQAELNQAINFLNHVME